MTTVKNQRRGHHEGGYNSKEAEKNIMPSSFLDFSYFSTIVFLAFIISKLIRGWLLVQPDLREYQFF